MAGDRLFLPVHRLNLVQRYGGADGAKPRIDRLGGATWEKAKQRVKKSMRNMAAELIRVHAARELVPGYSFSPRDTFFEEFEATFPFKKHRTSLPRSKTRCPTCSATNPWTDSCAETWVMARPRSRSGPRSVRRWTANKSPSSSPQPFFANSTTKPSSNATRATRFGSNTSRVFQGPKESRAVIEGCATGDVDVVIGTHRLLQKSMNFRNLGLLVIDEEHRFGVTHKERIKQMKKTIDVVTLTATPIPRTLQMAFTGVRDLSVINTPPADRFAIRTQVSRFDEPLIREAILRETRRGGQAFFVHNRVKSIGEVAQMLERVVPEVSFVVGHGQMKERELEDVMHKFMNGEADVLLCTTIIESGIDIPRANTIIINRAHTLGLAQMYQLRGRVGRSTHRAYAYLLVPSLDHLTSDAERRLEAIQDLSEARQWFSAGQHGPRNPRGRQHAGQRTVGQLAERRLRHLHVDVARNHGRAAGRFPERGS